MVLLFLQDLKQWVVTQYSTHFEELQTIIAVNTTTFSFYSNAKKAFSNVKKPLP
jgi:hypothetical protein